MSYSQAVKEAAALLAKWGVTVRVEPDAETNGRPFVFDPTGVMAHHTASSTTSSTDASRRVVRYGRAGIPGPLSQVFVCRDATVDFLSFGRANHAGAGGPWRTVPEDSGNRYLVGVEVDNNGVNEPYPARQLHAARLVYAALLIALKKDPTWLIGHKEWTTRKIDPRLDMAAERAAVSALIREKTAPPDVVHVVRRGDTLTSIAEDYGTTVKTLVTFNKLSDPDLLVLGQPIRIPAPRVYTVRRGDTLTRIAEANGTTVTQIVRLNRLADPNRLEVGQTLRLPA